MPTYQQILEMDFSVLTRAADSWKSTAAKYKSLADVFDKGVRSLSVGTDWRGESANASLQPLGVTRQEYAAAQRQSLAMESLLRDAHSTFVRLKGQLKSAIADAVAAGMKVSEGGVATYDFSKVDAATAHSVRHQPDLREVEQSYTRNITNAVKAVNDFDEYVKRALISETASDGSSPFGFNARPVGDIEAAAATGLAEKIRSGKATPQELEEFRNLVRQNSGDKHFSEAFLHALGAKEMVLLSDQMNLAAHERGPSASDRKLYESINAGLASTVASGTKDPNSYAYRPFVDGLKAFGDDTWGGTNPLHGYQALATLMSHGEGYGKQFLNEVGDGIIATEKANPRIWDHAYDVERPNLVTDPLDGLLKVMGKDPAAAEYFLDPAAEGNKNDHLKYLLTEREWSTSYMAPLYGTPKELEDPDRASGLGAAIQAAATGHEPGEKLGPPGPHTEGQARVMHHAIRELDGEMKGDELPEKLSGLRVPMARALADYVADTHVIFEGQNLGGVGGQESISRSDQGGHQIAVGQGSLVRVTRGLADDPYAFSLLHSAERVYAASLLDQLPAFAGSAHSESAAWNVEAKGIGHALGALNGIGEDVIADRHDDRDEWAEKTTTYTVNGVNAFVGEIPVVGSAASSLVDTVGFDWQKEQEDKNEDEAKRDRSKNYGTGADGLNQLLGNWGERESIVRSKAYEAAQDEANAAFDEGLGDAARHLRPPRG